MKKPLTIAFKDLLITFRDPAALVLMLVAPLALTLVIVLAFGSGGGGGTGLADIPVAIVNYDRGSTSGESSGQDPQAVEFGSFIVEAFQSEQLADLLEPTLTEDEDTARRQVDDDQLAALVIIPENFSESIMPANLSQADSNPQSVQKSEVVVYASPNRPISAGIVRSILDSLLADFSAGTASGQVSVENLILSGRISPDQAGEVGERLGRSAVERSQNEPLISIRRQLSAENESDEEFSYLEYMAPSMAILYLMFTMSNAGRSILVERDHGTLARMLVTPTGRAAVMGGKMLSTFLIGLLQMAILIVAGAFLFRMSWGPFPAVALLTVALVGAASGWGIVIASLARTPGQASAIGTAINLSFAALGGNFVPRLAYPEWLQNLGLITPNAWGLETYYNLINGAVLNDILPALLALGGMTVVLFGLAISLFRRQYA